MARRILTTHAGSLPRPAALTGFYARRQFGLVDIANNGEQQREAFFLYLRHRLSGIDGRWTRRVQSDVAGHPDFAEARTAALAGQVAPSVVWSKLSAMVAGARIASASLF